MSVASWIMVVLLVANGVFLKSDQITDRADPAYSNSVNRVVHPIAFTGAGGALVVRVCVDPAAENEPLVGPAQRVIARWNALVPTTGKYSRNGGLGRADAESVVTHELGHCAMGLGHSDHDVYPYYTRSLGDTATPDDPDTFPGSSDDLHLPVLPPTSRPDNLHFFRISDNNPFAIDSTVIDFDTYKRAVTPSNLPAGHRWAALGNQFVANLLGVPGTQDPMIGVALEEERYRGLIADNVSMVKLGMAGLDDQAGTGDDYTLAVSHEADCASADVRVQFGDLPANAFGLCVDSAPAQISGKHYRVNTLPGVPLVVILNRAKSWDFGAEVPIFFDPFESGKTCAWSATQPPLGQDCL